MRLALIALALLVAAPLAAAPLDRTVAVQGTVLTSAGTPAPGPHDLTLRLFTGATGGTAIHEQVFSGVATPDGVFDLELGPLAPSVVADETALWLEVVVDGVTLARRPLRPTPFALVAQRATSASTAASASDVACTGCVGTADVGFAWALGTSKGGAAADLDCAGCVTTTALAGGAVGSGQLQDGAVTAAKAGFSYAASPSPGGPATGLSCTGCVGSGHLAASLALKGPLTVEGSLTACTVGTACSLTLGAQKVARANDGWLHLQTAGGVRVRSADGAAFAPLSFAAGEAWGDLSVDGEAVVTGSLAVGTWAHDPDAALTVAGAITATGLLGASDAPLLIQQRGAAADLVLASEAGGELMRLSPATGRVGIGTAEPQATLDVAGGVRVGEDTGDCTAPRAGTLRWSSGLQVCDGQAWRPVDQPAHAGSSKGDAASSCLAIKQAAPTAQSGMFWVDPDGGSTDNAFLGYCDMTTDGGGWLLVATQKPDGALAGSASTSSVVLDKSVNQKYATPVYAAVASLGAYQVMVEENGGVDVSNGAIMVYRVPKNVALRFDGGNVALGTVEWWTGTGYVPVSNNASGNWLGISVHGDSFGGLAADKRCVKKSDFSVGVGTNGDYKLDHVGIHSGTTRCFHATVGIGVTHWVREVAELPSLPDGKSRENAAISCKHVKTDGYSTGSGYYWLDPNGGSTVDAFFGYCDMTTDGGGWLLLSTQNPDGNLFQTAPVGSVTLNKQSNQKYAGSVLSALAGLGAYQVLVEENQGADVSAGLVMVYKMSQGVPLRFDGGNVPVSQVQWHIGAGQYFTVSNNAAGNWWGISVHGDAFNGLASNKRCTVKANFGLTGGNNGDYKLDHAGTHSGTTRCNHGVTGIGVSHWVREL